MFSNSFSRESNGFEQHGQMAATSFFPLQIPDKKAKTCK